jgi:hypothetical protein
MQELLQTEVPGGLLELVLRPNLSILAPGNLGTPPKARDKLAENSRNFAFYESAFTSQAKQFLFFFSFFSAAGGHYHPAAQRGVFRH